MEALLFFKLLFAASWSRRRQARAHMSGLTTAEVWRSFNHRVRRLRSWEVLVRVDVWAVERASSLGDGWVWLDVNIWGTSSRTTSTTCLEVGAGVRYSKASSLPSPSSLEIVRSTNSEILELEEVWVGLAGGGEKSGRKGSSTIRICLSLKPDVLPGGDWVRSKEAALDDRCLECGKLTCVLRWVLDKWTPSGFVGSLRLGTSGGPSRAIISSSSSSSSITIAFWGAANCRAVAFLTAINCWFCWPAEFLILAHLPHFHINFAAGLCFAAALKALIIAMSSLSVTGGEWHPK